MKNIIYFWFSFSILYWKLLSAAPAGGGDGKGLLQSGAEFGANLFAPTVKSRENVNLESESFPSRLMDLYDQKQKSTIDIFNPKPIIDTISENEKYGNNGDKFYGFGRVVVNGYEAFSNFMNKILDTPGNIASSVSQKLTENLDNIGGKLVGLA